MKYDAMRFAIEKHGEQKRKYIGEPYWKHLAEVAGIVSTVQVDDYVIATAWLHDVIEDCSVSPLEIEEKFSKEICEGVVLLSDMENGNRATRKKLSRERLSDAPFWVQNIKVSDLISNTSSIVLHDPEFAKIYLEEKKLLLDVLTKADKKLIDMAKSYL